MQFLGYRAPADHLGVGWILGVWERFPGARWQYQGTFRFSGATFEEACHAYSPF